jgi:hypothetical protein
MDDNRDTIKESNAMKIPKTPRGLKNQIARLRAKLSDFEMEHGSIDDSSGNRYYLFYLYFILNDNAASSEYIKWYEKHFPNDIGEPFQLLCWALIAHRMGLKAEKPLARTMLSNIYLLPRLLGQPSSGTGDWHAITFEEPEYLESPPEEVIKAITDEDREWIRELYQTENFQNLLQRFIDIQTELKTIPVGEERTKLVYESYHLVDRFESI